MGHTVVWSQLRQSLSHANFLLFNALLPKPLPGVGDPLDPPVSIVAPYVLFISASPKRAAGRQRYARVFSVLNAASKSATVASSISGVLLIFIFCRKSSS